MKKPDPLLELIKILARQQARMNVDPPRPANQNDDKKISARKK